MGRCLIASSVLLIAAGAAFAQVRIKDITEVAGARSNQLIGVGLVVGLDGTGSRSSQTQQMNVDMLQRLGVSSQIFSASPAEAIMRSTNSSMVMVTAEIGPFTRRGGKIDVSVSSMDDARSLQGGKLLRTLLKGVDGQVYAVAQGELSLGGFAVAGQAAGVQKNQVNTGRVPNGAMVEKEAPGELMKNGRIQFLLREPDANTARLIAQGINRRLPDLAVACDPGCVEVRPPHDPRRCVNDLIAEIGLIEVRPDAAAKVIIMERTGTVVAGENVTISAVAVSHGNLFVTFAETPLVSQPTPFSGGATAAVPRTQVAAAEPRSRMLPLAKATTVADVARAMNALGVSPRDLVAIFQALKQAGALHAELQIH